ncbi:hypothetical protein KKC60_04750 [Patescibacteria group bacterium]|nr:hypothetical protein [Patescibacteria group bacterium]
MIELIALIVFFVSLAGILVVAFRKIPQLLELSEAGPLVLDCKKLPEKAKKLPFLKNLSFDLLLQKTLSKFKIITLKTENRTSNLLQRLREDSKRKKFGEDDNYWEEIKKLTKK